MAYEEEEASKDAAIRKAIKDVGIEVERTEGRGLLKVGLKNISILVFVVAEDKNSSYQKPCPDQPCCFHHICFHHLTNLFRCIIIVIHFY